MQSKRLLLSAGNINKAYHHPLKSGRRLLTALLKPKTPGSIKVLTKVSLKIYEGESIGILGRNGAGKTTLLSILGGIIKADSGSVDRFCKISTLLGVSSGLNPKLTGRENAYMFCGMQGLNQSSINGIISDIQGFADLGEYFDMPLRTYSSGMVSRLGFSAAIHTDADLIIVDETLSVGDAVFRLKCYDKINSLKKQGKTFLLVSHSQNLVSNFCDRGIVLDQGKIACDSDTLTATNVYKEIRVAAEANLPLSGVKIREKHTQPKGVKKAILKKFSLEEVSENYILKCIFIANEDINTPSFSLGIRSHEGIIVSVFHLNRAGMQLPSLHKGDKLPLELQIKRNLLPGAYFLNATAYETINDVTIPLCTYQNVIRLDVKGESQYSGIVDLGMVLSFQNKA
ncbi:MAG: ABC transporter ATP-binding protein [Gammaproteobacteria bacterium]